MNLTIFGGGAWGSALAVSVAGHRPTLLWVRSERQAQTLAETGRNPRYLPGVALPPSLRVSADFAAAVAHAAVGLAIIATPIAALAEVLGRLAAAPGKPPAGILWLCKGFEPIGGQMGHEICRSLSMASPVGVLSGPSFALEVARGQPTALVAASHDPQLVERAVAALHHDALRVYTSSDPVGVEVGGAVKNVLAIATGIADGMTPPPGAGTMPPSGTGSETIPGSGNREAATSTTGLGLNARAALITRGLAEMTRLGLALGARAETFMGLSGLGDLVLTATGELSRNRQVGRLLAQGRALPQILAELGHVAEGVASAPMVVQRARALGVDMPIAEAVAEVLAGRRTPAAALEQLMGRESRSETLE